MYEKYHYKIEHAADFRRSFINFVNHTVQVKTKVFV